MNNRAKSLGEVVEYLAKIDAVLSRTAVSGMVDTSTASEKKTLDIGTLELTSKIEHNRALAAEYIVWRAAWLPDDVAEHLAIMYCLAQLVNFGLLPQGLFREWSYDPDRFGVRGHGALVEPAEIPKALWGLMVEVAEGSSLGVKERIGLLVRIEWSLGVGALHPFYDGCGRISRYYSCLLALWWQLPWAVHTSRREYFEAASEGLGRFVQYYRQVMGEDE